jgi:tetratricopeptide (TPR) repeat protein
MSNLSKNTTPRGGRSLLENAVLALVVALAVTVAGCTKVGELQASRSAKAANTAYAAQDYPKAAALYEEAIHANPELGFAYFYLGNSLEQQWKPSRRGEPDNDALLTRAVENYKIAAEKLQNAQTEQERNLATLSMKYLVNAYGVDRMNDPAQQEPILISMIQRDPADTQGYFSLANVYEQAGEYDDAERLFLLARDVKPNDPEVYLQLAGYYNRQGQFDKTIESLERRAEREPNNPLAFQMIGGYFEEEVRSDTRLTDAQKAEYIQKGLQAVDKALQLNKDYVDALVFRGLLLRHQARLEKDQAKVKDLLQEATELSERANELRKKQAAGS